MHEWNQGADRPSDAPTPITPAPGAAAPTPEPVEWTPLTTAWSSDPDESAATPLPPSPSITRGLKVWLALFVVLGVGGLLLGQVELGVFVILAGLCIAAQAADVEPRWRDLYYALSWITPVLGAGFLGALGFYLVTQSPPGTARTLGVGLSFGGAVLSLLTIFRPFSNGLTAVLFRTAEATHMLRLAARLALIGWLAAIPSWVAFQSLIALLAERPEGLLNARELWGALIGETLVALAAIGFLIRRDLRATLERLGLGGVRWSHVGVMLIACVVTVGINIGSATLEQRYFPAYYVSDKHVIDLMLRGMGTAEGVLLGVSAGIGEELVFRGALQPRLGIVLSALLFASLHGQYSWYGMGEVLALGLILGVVRKRANTTAAIVVHAAYDLVGVFAGTG